MRFFAVHRTGMWALIEPRRIQMCNRSRRHQSSKQRVRDVQRRRQSPEYRVSYMPHTKSLYGRGSIHGRWGEFPGAVHCPPDETTSSRTCLACGEGQAAFVGTRGFFWDYWTCLDNKSYIPLSPPASRRAVRDPANTGPGPPAPRSLLRPPPV
jgi:hypothetical protein